MIAMTAQIDGAASEMIQKALTDYSRNMGKATQQAPKVAAYAVCDSLAPRTLKAPKMARPKEYIAATSANPPKYITYRRGKKLDPALHRWTLTRKLGTPDENTHDYYVYTHHKTRKIGKVVEDLTAEKRELRKYHLSIFHAGLAKASWKWAKHDIHGGGEDPVWKRRKRDRRNPKDDVKGSYQKQETTLTSGGRAEIHNHLDYINNALKPMALSEAMKAAAAKLAFKSAKAQGMTPEEAAAYARDLASSFAT